MTNSILNFRSSFLAFGITEAIGRAIMQIIYQIAAWPFLMITHVLSTLNSIFLKELPNFLKHMSDSEQGIGEGSTWDIAITILFGFIAVIIIIGVIAKFYLKGQASVETAGNVMKKTAQGFLAAAIVPILTMLFIVLITDLTSALSEFLNKGIENNLAQSIFEAAGGGKYWDGDDWVITGKKWGNGDYDNIQNLNYLVIWIGCGFIGYVLLMNTVGIVGKMMELMFLWAISSIVALTYVVDGGTRLKKYIGMTVAKVSSIISQVFGFFMFIIILNFANSEIFTEGGRIRKIISDEFIGQHLEQTAAWGFAGVIFILAAGSLVGKVSTMISQFIGDITAAGEFMQDAMGAKQQAGMMKSALGSVFIGNKLKNQATGVASSAGTTGMTNNNTLSKKAPRAGLGAMTWNNAKSLGSKAKNTRIGRGVGAAAAIASGSAVSMYATGKGVGRRIPNTNASRDRKSRKYHKQGLELIKKKENWLSSAKQHVKSYPEKKRSN